MAHPGRAAGEQPRPRRVFHTVAPATSTTRATTPQWPPQRGRGYPRPTRGRPHPIPPGGSPPSPPTPPRPRPKHVRPVVPTVFKLLPLRKRRRKSRSESGGSEGMTVHDKGLTTGEKSRHRRVFHTAAPATSTTWASNPCHCRVLHAAATSKTRASKPPPCRVLTMVATNSMIRISPEADSPRSGWQQCA